MYLYSTVLYMLFLSPSDLFTSLVNFLVMYCTDTDICTYVLFGRFCMHVLVHMTWHDTIFKSEIESAILIFFLGGRLQEFSERRKKRIFFLKLKLKKKRKEILYG